MIVGDGRPLRFLASLTGGWVLLRFALIWHDTGSLSQAVRGVLPLPTRAIAAADPPAERAPVATVARITRRAGPATPHIPEAFAQAPITPVVADPMRVQMALIAMTRFGAPIDTSPAPAAAAQGLPYPPSNTRTMLGGTSIANRLSVSSWMIARSGLGGGATALAPQLGGTQGGIRVDYTIRNGIAATARVAAPAAGAGRELSVGVAFRPKGVPLRLVAEQRMALDGGRGGPALGVSGGVDAVPVAAGFSLQGYAQAGTILRDGMEHYADGSARATRQVGAIGGIAIDAGAGAWGGAQRGVARLDLGPSVGAVVPVAGRRLRLAVEWRQRVAGHARPGSGPALALGTDF